MSRDSGFQVSSFQITRFQTMKILICDGLEESGLALFEAAEGIEVDAHEQLSAEEIKARLPEYDAMVVRSRTRVTAELLDHGTRLKVIGRAGTGVDNIDVKTASSRGILVMNTPGANAMAAAEHTLALMLALARYVPQANQSMHDGRWEKKAFVGTELYGQTLGVIGLGKIGSIVADRALGMKMDVLCFDPYVLPEAAAIHGVELVSLDELLARSDFITLHTPMTPETRQIVNRTNLARMKAGVRLINCARGGLVDEEALYEALVQGHVGGAALDVFNQEPPTGNPAAHPAKRHLHAPSRRLQRPGSGQRGPRHRFADSGLPAGGRHPQCRELSFHAPQGLREDPALSVAGRTAGEPPGAALHPHSASRDRLPGERSAGSQPPALDPYRHQRAVWTPSWPKRSTS